MKTITYELGGKLRSVMVPAESAAYIQHTDYKAGTAVIIIRMKKASEENALVAFNNAKKENPSPRWQPLSRTGYLETAGGVSEQSNPYYKLSFIFRDNDWHILVDEAMLEFKQAQRDTLATGAPLPNTSQVEAEEIKTTIDLLAQAAGGGRWQ